MTIIIEIGTGLDPNANSYATAAQARAYAAARGTIVSSDDTVVEPMLILAMDYLEGLYSEYQGSPTTPGVQPLQWPRNDVELFCTSLANNVIPKQLIDAQCLLVIDQVVNGSWTQASDGRFVIEETTGPITTKYSEKIGTQALSAGSPVMQMVTNKLAPLMNDDGEGFTLYTERA